MPIEFRSGLPGSGKTLGVVEYLMELRKREPHRPVKVLGITDLREDLADKIAPEDLLNWKQFAAGTIIVVDECQKYMPVRRAGDPPRWISDLSEHRHLGLDFVFISQHPALIDPYVRRLVDRHIHTVRKFGTHWVERWSWPELQSDPTSRMSIRAAEGKTRHKYAKSAMSAYTSSELHTVKRTVPRFIYIAGAMLFVIPALGYVAWRTMQHSETYVPGNRPTAASVSGTSPAVSAPLDRGAPLTAKQWADRSTPRVAGIPWSAPMWDNLSTTTVPDLLCVIFERTDRTRDCRCYTEQVTRIAVDSSTCFRAASDGIYNPYRAAPDSRVAGSGDRGHARPDSLPEGTVGDSPASSGEWPAGVGAQVYTPPAAPGSWHPDALGSGQGAAATK